MGLKEELASAYIKNKYNNGDYFSRIYGLICSWDNVRDDGIRILTRLDKFYCFPSLVQIMCFDIMNYKMLGNSTFSDHHPISLLIDLSDSHPGGSSWKANVGFFQDVKDPIKVSWEASPPHMSFFAN